MDLIVHKEKIVGSLAAWRSAEKSRAQAAGETRQEIGELLDLTGLNKKALSFVRSLDKMEEDKRNDVIRSLDPLLEMMAGVWDTGTGDMFDDGDAVEALADDDSGVTAEYESDGSTDEALEEMAGEFDGALADLEEEPAESNVRPFGAVAAG